MAGVYVATLVAPKAKELIEVRADDRHGTGFRLFAAGCGENCSVLGESYTADQAPTGYETVRVHTPRGVTVKGKGYGLVLYCGTALGVELLRKLDGVHSFEDGRSSAASRFWRSAVQQKLAVQVEGEGEEEEDTMEHCESISNEEIEDGRITSDEVCGEVNVVRVSRRDYDVLLAEEVRDSGLVFHHAKPRAEFKPPPPDLMAGIDLTTLKAGGMVDAKFLWRVAEVMAKENMDVARRYLRRADVQEAIVNDPQVLPTYLEFFGQKRLTLGELRRRGLGAVPIMDPLPLPAESARTRALLDRFGAFD